MLKLENLSVLLTGAGGFLGGVIASYLVNNGAHVVGTILPSEYLQVGVPVVLDLEDPLTLTQLDSCEKFDAIIHCAAILPGGRLEKDLLIGNQKMTYNILNWGVRSGVRYFLFASSCSIYGSQPHPCDESSLFFPPNTYAVSKIACEHMVILRMQFEGMRSCVLRISAPFGPSMKAETVIKRFCIQASQNEALTVRGSGRRSQDFVYEDDVAGAFALALSNEASGVYNISGSRSISTLEVAETISRIFGKDPHSNIVFKGDDVEESFRGRYLTDAASRAFGYKPQVALEDGLRRTVQAWKLL